MSYYIKAKGKRYDDLKSLSFAPELDPTMATLPICEYEAEIVTDEAAESFIDEDADLYESRTAAGYYTELALNYTVTEARQAGRGVVYIRAQSIVGWLDKRVLEARYVENMRLDKFVYWIFNERSDNWGYNPPYSDYEPYTIPSEDAAILLTGYCPEQTARERLQWICQAMMYVVIQWGHRSADGLCITTTQDALAESDRIIKTLQPRHIYRTPVIRHMPHIRLCKVTYYFGFTTSPIIDPYGRKVESVVLREAQGDPDSSSYQEEIRLYYMSWTGEYSHDSAYGAVVEMTGNTMLSDDLNHEHPKPYYRPVFREHEVELDLLQLKQSANTDYIWPGDLVRFYTDPATAYTGMVKSCRFTFGKLARATLVISTYLEPETMYHLTVKYSYSGRALARRDYYLPKSDAYYNIAHPTLSLYVVDRLETFTPRVASSSGTLTGDKTITIQYNRE